MQLFEVLDAPAHRQAATVNRRMSSEPPSTVPKDTDNQTHGAISPAQAPAGCLASFGMISVALLVLATAVGGVLAGRYLLAPSPLPAKTVVRAGPPTIVAIRSLARLETAQFHMERVIDLRNKQERLMGLIDTEDAILLVAAARVTAGVDLEKVSEESCDVDDEGKKVSITLPAPEVFEAALDNERTYVHTRETGMLADRVEGLETKARQEAERRLREAAQEAGLLDLARQNAERTVRSLLESLGFESIEINFEASSSNDDGPHAEP